MDLDTLQTKFEGLFPDLLGIRLTSATPERVEAELMVRDDLCTLPGRMHGGAIMAFADTLGGLGTALNLPDGTAVWIVPSQFKMGSAIAMTAVARESTCGSQSTFSETSNAPTAEVEVAARKIVAAFKRR